MKYNKFIRDESLIFSGHPVGLHMGLTANLAQAMARVLSKLYGSSNFIRFICQGSSGAIISAMVYQEIRLIPQSPLVLEIVHIKKEGEQSHFPGHTITHVNFVKNIIIDDFIASGRTVRRVYDTFLAANELETIDAIIVGGKCAIKSVLHSYHLRDVVVDKFISEGEFDL